MTEGSPNARVAAAQARAAAARARLANTIGALQERARPTSLVHDVTQTLKDRGTDIATGVVDRVKQKPARAGAVLAVAGLFLARHRIAGLIGRVSGRTSPKKFRHGASKP